MSMNHGEYRQPCKRDGVGRHGTQPNADLKAVRTGIGAELRTLHSGVLRAAQALVLKDETDRVFVEVTPWTFESRPVGVGFQQGDQAVVEHGLKPGERIVVKGGVLLND